ncbi:MAG: yesS [Chthoniobacteraceae bacterium]|nr:yesS [Chthoniobacteraceae bacterium]
MGTNTHGILIETLRQSETFDAYGHAFAETTGMPVTLRPIATKRLPFRGSAKENAFCAIMAEKEDTCAACRRLQERLALEATDQPTTRACAYGLCETAVPVKLGSQTIGFLQTGQVLRQKPSDASFRLTVAQAWKLGVDIRNLRTKRAYFDTPVVSQKKLDAAANLLVVFADHLAMKSNQILMQAETAEPLVIARAKHFIREHFAEEISLTQVSRVVNTSLYHFCKLFRRSTSLTFTEFVSRTRIEKAKLLLLNPNLRISEIGFAVGFQSLTHFNRMFKKIEMLSPTTYRAELPASTGAERPALRARSCNMGRTGDGIPAFGKLRSGYGVGDLKIDLPNESR